MQARNAGLKAHLRSFDFRKLFIDELGWDRSGLKPISVRCGTESFHITAIAEKRGMVAFQCRNDEGRLATGQERRLIEKQIARSVHEHILIYVDQPETTQVWQWIRREPGKPISSREHRFSAGQDGEALAQKLETLAFSIEEEESLNISKVADRARQAFDVDKVTKRFYGRFRAEHDAFLDFIRGIKTVSEREWYASLMLNRLMFVYFIQKKGFLDGDLLYLQNRLRRMKQLKGKDKFQSFYRHFLLRLFHEGLGSPNRSSELDFLLGRVPYLNGGLFDVHELERQNEDIEISDDAFERLFAFFESYQWHLDDRGIGADNEINPDVLGYIFENYINQKQMGAYYTKGDITEYISRNCVFPYLLSEAARQRPDYFGENGPIWGLLKNDPDRYIFHSVSSGAGSSIPENIARGIEDTASRSKWNEVCTAKGALVTETWREFIGRRERYRETRAKLAGGGITHVDGLIEWNLNLAQFLQDVVESCDDVGAFGVLFAIVSRVTILDPTCGSGAFVFAALKLLEPIYDACIEKMQSLYGDASPEDIKKHRELRIFKSVLDTLGRHPNRAFFVTKSIILNNLYGVDIMKEAVEVCKLRLFLKLASLVGRIEDVEPLPDIDFNFRSGNTLIGVCSKSDLSESIEAVGRQLRLGSDGQRKIIEIAEQIDAEYRKFRSLQVDHNINSEKIADAKDELQRVLLASRAKLDALVALEYGVDPKDAKKFQLWDGTHRPFHWLAEFYGVMRRGGFDVIIGNPPYIEWKDVEDYRLQDGEFKTRDCGNVYAAMCERSYDLMAPNGRFGMIVPLSCVATERMDELRGLWEEKKLVTHVSHYSGDAHPAVLFDGVKFRLSILLQHVGTVPSLHSTHFQKWFSEGRADLFPLVAYTPTTSEMVRMGLPPKVGGQHHAEVLRKIVGKKKQLGQSILKNSEHAVYAHRIIAHFVKAFDFVPFFKNERDGKKKSEDYKVFGVSSELEQQVLCALLNSNLFYCWFVTFSDVYHCGRELILDFPCDLVALTREHGKSLAEKNKKVMESLKANSVRRKIPYKKTGLVQYDEFYPRLSKSVLDTIDPILASYYGLTAEELDFVVNYDFKFRVGSDSDEE